MKTLAHTGTHTHAHTLTPTSTLTSTHTHHAHTPTHMLSHSHPQDYILTMLTHPRTELKEGKRKLNDYF